jgi:hypothetical protein
MSRDEKREKVKETREAFFLAVKAYEESDPENWPVLADAMIQAEFHYYLAMKEYYEC